MTISIRDWATPLVAGAFLLSAVTGVLIFFHLDSGLNKEAHEWLGWALVLGAVFHVVANFAAFKKRFERPLTRVIVGVFAGLLLLSFISLGGDDEKSGMRAGVDGLMNAPLSVVAQVAHKDVNALMADLAAGGYTVASSETSINDASGGDREKMMAALGIAFKN